MLNNKVVAALLRFIGYEVDYNFKFKIREESTASASVNYNGFIVDFGAAEDSTFTKGDIFKFLCDLYQLHFKQVINYIKCCLGVRSMILPQTLTYLPNPLEFGKKIRVVKG